MILVTGGAGYLGSHVVNILGDDAVVYDSLLYADEYRRTTEFVRGDVTDYVKLKPLLDKADAVVWLAAIVGDGACAEDPARASSVNDEAVRFLSENYDGPVVFASTASVYGATEGSVTEEAEPNPLSFYAETKLRAEEHLEGKALIFRLGTLHGVSDRMRFDLIVNAMTKDAVRTGTITVFGGHQVRPLLSVKAAAVCIGAAVRGWNPGTYNLSTSNATVRNVARAVSSVTGADIEDLKTPSEDRRSYAMDSSAGWNALGSPSASPPPDWFVESSSEDVKQLILSGRLKDLDHPRYYNARRR